MAGWEAWFASEKRQKQQKLKTSLDEWKLSPALLLQALMEQVDEVVHRTRTVAENRFL